MKNSASNTEQGKVNEKKVIANADRSTINQLQKVNNMPVSKEFDSSNPSISAKTESSIPAVKESEKTVADVENPTPELKKTDIEQEQNDTKVVRTLEETIEISRTLTVLIAQRAILSKTKDKLSAFVLSQKDDDTEIYTNQFQGCKCILQDGKGNEFTCHNPFVISEVVVKLISLMTTKLSDTEAKIVFP